MSIVHNTINHPYSIFLKSNSASSANEGKSECEYLLERTINVPTNVDCYVSLTSCKFINAFYNIDEHNNVFSSDLFDIVVTPGNYSIKQLIEYLNAEQAYATFSYDTITYKVTITCSVLDVYQSTLLPVLGFVNEDFTILTLAISQYVFNLSGVNAIYISLDNLTLANNSIQDNGLMKCIECIPISVVTGYSQVYEASTNTHYKLYDDTIRRIKIRITDESNELVNFRGTDYFITLHFSFSYNNVYIPGQSLLSRPEQPVNDTGSEK